VKRLTVLLLCLLLAACAASRVDSPLTKETRDLNYERVKAVVDAGADLNELDENGFTPLMTAAYYGNGPIVKYLCEKGADVNVRDKDGNTALMYASAFGFENVVKTLLAYKADVHFVNKQGYKALTSAAKEHQAIIVKCLEEAGAQP
jgi:uncharacterized protein